MATEILNFYDIIVNQLIGDPTLFILIAFIIITAFLVLSRVPNNVLNYVLLAVTGILAIVFPILRWGLVLFGLGFVGWVFIRLRRE